MKECIGNCKHHVGRVRPYLIIGDWYSGVYLYCHNAQQADVANGFIVVPLSRSWSETEIGRAFWLLAFLGTLLALYCAIAA